jgi:ribosome recycling factor
MPGHGKIAEKCGFEVDYLEKGAIVFPETHESASGAARARETGPAFIRAETELATGRSIPTMSELNDLLDELEERMMKSEDSMKHDFSAIRTGKASTALVEPITIDYYGAQTKLRDVAGISTPDARTISIQPWDKSVLAKIEKAIIASNLGITPLNDGKVIRLPIPPLSGERRQQLTKQVKARCEEAKVSVRNIRRDGNETAKKMEKDSVINEDELKDVLEKIQKLTDEYIKNLDVVCADKEKEIMTV